VSGVPLHLERRGRGPALMLLHGFTGSGRSMAGVAQAFEREYEILAPDLPGHGRSDVPLRSADYGFNDCVDDLLATLAAAGHARAHLLGYSMGARVALGYAVRHPASVATLILVGPRAGISDPDKRAARRRADEALAARIETEGVEKFVDEWMAQPVVATQRNLGPEFFAQARRDRLANSAQGLAASLRRLGPGAQPPLFDALPHMTAPTLLVAGALDREFVESAHDLARRMPRAEVCEIADAGHAAHLEQPEAFVRAVHEFLRRAEGPEPSIRPIPVQETPS